METGQATKPVEPNDWQSVEPDDWQTVSSGPAPKKPLPELPQDFTGAVVGVPEFLRQTKAAAGKDVSSAFQGLKRRASEMVQQLKEDPSRIVPMWFGAEEGALEAAGKTVATPVEAAFRGDISDALSSAAGGDPKAAQEYAAKGDNGGEFWEMLGKPLALIAAGELAGRAGGAASGALASRANDASLAIMRDITLRGSLDQTGVDMAEVQLARDAMQDAAQDRFGAGPKGAKELKRLAPKRSFVSPVTKPERGNRELLELSRHAVDLAGEPADRVNAIFGYLDGRQAAGNIRTDLLRQASAAEQAGAHTYANALRARANSFDRLTQKGTLGQIYDVKKTANRLADVARNTQEAIDLMDSYAAMASAIRREVYPIYERNIGAVTPGQGFSLSQAGRKEGAAISFRNGLEKSWRQAQERTGDIYRSGQVPNQSARGVSPRHVATGFVSRTGQKLGIIPNAQGGLNRDVLEGIGEVPAGQFRESLQLSSPAQFGPAPRASQLALPGHTYRFKIPAVPPEIGREGQIGHSAALAPRHSFEQPAYTTSSAPTRTATFTPDGGVVAGPEGSMGADVRTAGVPTPQSDVARGGGVLETSDPKVAQSALDRMVALEKRYSRNGATYREHMRLKQAIADLKHQIEEYESGIGKAAISHTPPTATYMPRTLAPRKKPLPKAVRRGLPAPLAGWQREESQQNPTDAWQGIGSPQ